MSNLNNLKEFEELHVEFQGKVLNLKLLLQQNENEHIENK